MAGAFSSVESSLLESESDVSDDDVELDNAIGDIIAGGGEGGFIDATLGGLQISK